MNALEGAIPALLTPFTEGGEQVDFALLDEHVGWLAERGVRTVSPLGSTGEGVSLSLEERKRVIERLARHRSGVALVPGTGASALPETIELSRFAVEQGAAAVLVAPPSYYPVDDHRGTTAYFARLFEALPRHARVLLYHIPRYTGVPVEDETLRTLGERFGPMLAGAKDSGGDFQHTLAWLRDFPALTILNGSDDTAAAAYRAGGKGTLTMLANIFPEELEAIRAGNEPDAHQSFLREVRKLVEQFPRHAALKHLLHLETGLPRSSVRPPLDELTPEATAVLGARYTALRGEIHA